MVLSTKYQENVRVSELFNSTTNKYYYQFDVDPQHTYNLSFTYSQEHPHTPIAVLQDGPPSDDFKYCYWYDSGGNNQGYGETAFLGGRGNLSHTYTNADWDQFCADWYAFMEANQSVPFQNPYSVDQRAIVFNDEDQVSMIADPADNYYFVYDYSGRRASKRSDSLGEYAYVSPYYVMERGIPMKYIFAAGKRVAGKPVGNNLCRNNFPANSPNCQFFFHADESSSTEWITNLDGLPIMHYAYHPTGEEWVTEVFQPSDAPASNEGAQYLFHGEQQDETGLYFTANKKHYDPQQEITM